jgi:O-antigen ligase
VATLAIVAAVLVVGYVAAPMFRDRLDSAVHELSMALAGQEYATNQGERIAGMIVAAEIIKRHPILGTGVGDNMNEFRILLAGPPYQHLRTAVGWFPHLHNQYLQVATELGVVGLVVLLSVFYQLFRSRYADREARIAAAILGCVYLFGFLGDPYFHKQLPVALFGLVGGLLFAPTLSVWWHTNRDNS